MHNQLLWSCRADWISYDAWDATRGGRDAFKTLPHNCLYISYQACPNSMNVLLVAGYGAVEVDRRFR